MTYDHKTPALALLIAIPLVCLFAPWGGADGPSRPNFTSCPPGDSIPGPMVPAAAGPSFTPNGPPVSPGRAEPQAAARGVAVPLPPPTVAPAPAAIVTNRPNMERIAGISGILPELMDYIWLRESNYGLDPNCWKIGPAGEYGEFQIIPIFVADVERISGFTIDRSDNDSCRAGIEMWLNHYAPRVGAVTTDELYELYRRGPAGYRRTKGI